MAMKCAINGFGRIGRAVFRYCAEHAENDILPILVNDPYLTIEQFVYLLTHDSIYRNTISVLSFDERSSTRYTIKYSCGGKEFTVEFLREEDIANLDFNALVAESVFECSGALTDDECRQFLTARAKFVLKCSPAGTSIPSFVPGINGDDWENHRDATVVSCSSCSTQALAFALNAIVKEGLQIDWVNAQVIRSYTADQSLTDGGGTEIERGRAAAFNIVPTSTSASKQIAALIPTLTKNAFATAFRTPTPIGGCINIVMGLRNSVRKEEILGILKKNESEFFDVSSDPLVSSDIIGSEKVIALLSSIVVLPDASNGSVVSFTVLYDNEYTFAANCVKMMQIIGR